MKKNILYLSALFSVVFFFSSCGSDNERTFPSIAGQWTTVERTFTSENYPERADLINEALREYMAKYKLEKYFPAQSQITIPPDTIQGAYTFTATLPGTSIPTRSVDGIYKMSGDSILFFDKIGTTSRVKFMLGEKILITFQKLNKNDLIILFNEIETSLILPDDIIGELKTKDVR